MQTSIPFDDELAARALAELGPQVALASIPRAGHALLPEQPEAAAEALIRFAKALS